jgi:hypothetical protein
LPLGSFPPWIDHENGDAASFVNIVLTDIDGEHLVSINSEDHAQVSFNSDAVDERFIQRRQPDYFVCPKGGIERILFKNLPLLPHRLFLKIIKRVEALPKLL